jgi:NAD(P)H-hydrate epimerase
MIPVLTASQVRALEESTERAGRPMAGLMETAGEALAQAALSLATPASAFWVVCGPGNNGGDGLCAARALIRFGRSVAVTLVGDPGRRSPLAKAQGSRLERLVTQTPLERVAVQAGDVVIDALLGTGLNRAPTGAMADGIRAIAAARARGARVVSADLPSGLPSDTPTPFEPCVQADLTVAFGAPKVAQVLEPGATRCGRLQVVDLGLLGEVPRDIQLLEEQAVRACLPPRAADTHKGTYGHVLVVAGGPGKTGAAAMSGLGALRGGAGLVTVATREEALPWVQLHAPELMGVPLTGSGPLGLGDLEALVAAGGRKDAVVLGPGIPRGVQTVDLIGELLAQGEVPFVLDADALNAVAERLEVLARAHGEVVLTPHPGEMATLLGTTTAKVQQDRLGAARTLATARRVTVVLKGARTLIAHPDGTVSVNPTGNPGMATGGAGDVLSGLLGALLAQGLSAKDAAQVGVFAHGLAGDLVRERVGALGLMATDLLAGLCEVWTRWKR